MRTCSKCSANEMHSASLNIILVRATYPSHLGSTSLEKKRMLDYPERLSNIELTSPFSAALAEPSSPTRERIASIVRGGRESENMPSPFCHPHVIYLSVIYEREWFLIFVPASFITG